MATHIEIQLPGPLANVGTSPATVDPQLQSQREQQIRQEMQVRIDAELDELRNAQASLMDGEAKFRKLQEDFLKEAEGQLLKLAMEIARKVLMQEIKAGHHEVDPIVQEALLRVPAQTNVVVHLHPDDLSRCDLARRDETSADSGSIRFIADPSIHRAECLLKTSQGTVESSIEGHLEEISDVLKNLE